MFEHIIYFYFLYFYFIFLNFIYFTTITKQVIQHNHAHWHRCLRTDGLRVGGNRSAWRKPTCLTTWSSHMLTPCIEPRSQRWEASVLHCASQTALSILMDRWQIVNLSTGIFMKLEPDTHRHILQHHMWRTNFRGFRTSA